MPDQTVEGRVLILSKGPCLPVILIVVLGPLIGCGSIAEVGDPDNDGLPNFNSDGGAGSVENPSSDVGAGDPDSGGGEEPQPDTTEPSDPGTEDPPDAEPEEPPEPSDEASPDFSLTDVNADSPRYQEAVSPRDYLGQVSAWYFGHST